MVLHRAIGAQGLSDETEALYSVVAARLEEGRQREGFHGFARRCAGWMGWWSRGGSRRRGGCSRRRARRRRELAARGTGAGERAARRQRWPEGCLRGGERA